MHFLSYFLAIISVLSAANLLKTSNFTITGQIQCDNGPHVATVIVLVNSQENSVNLEQYDYFSLEVPRNQTITIQVQHPYCKFLPVTVKTDSPHEIRKFVYLHGVSKEQNCWWKSPSIMVFFILNFLVVVAFWAMAKYRRKVVLVREVDVEDGIRLRKD